MVMRFPKQKTWQSDLYVCRITNVKVRRKFVDELNIESDVVYLTLPPKNIARHHAYSTDPR